MRSQLYDIQKYYNLIGYIKQLQMIVKYEYVNLVYVYVFYRSEAALPAVLITSIVTMKCR